MYIYKHINLVPFYFLAPLIFFPSITFSLIQAEIFPWASIFVLIYMRKYNFGLLFITIYFLLSGTYAIYVSNGYYIQETIRSFAAYLNPLLAFVFFIKIADSNIYRFAKLVKLIFFGLMCIGLLQASGLIYFLDPFFKFFIPRAYSFSMNAMGNRGVTLLSNEPARAGVEFLFIYLVVRTVFLTKRQKVVSDLFVGFFILLIIKSFICISLYVVFILLFYRFKILIILIPFTIYTYLGISSIDYGNRFFILLKNIAFMTSFEDVIHYLSNMSGHRLISIKAAYSYGLYFPFGGGIGNWMTSSIEAVKLAGIEVSSLNYFIRFGDQYGEASFRSSGYVSNLMMDIGIFGTILILSFLFKFLKRYWIISLESKAIILLFFVKICFLGSVGNPVMWVTTVICLRYLYIERDERQMIKSPIFT